MFKIVFYVLTLIPKLKNSMVISTDVALVVSLSVNMWVIIYCACCRLQRCLRTKSCCGATSCLVNICQSYSSRTQELSKSLTEQVMVVVTSLLAVVCICQTNVIRVPFSNNLSVGESYFIEMVLAINVGRYIYLLFQDTFLFPYIEKQKFRTDLVHHIVTVVCYCIILGYQQNMLLGVLGILTEVNTSVIEITKIMKTLGRHKTEAYRKMSVVSCAFTIVFRAVIPVIFLIMGMFHETPFVMHYTALTVFFLSIIFFSVINVWLVLSTVQRVLKVYGSAGSVLDPERQRSDIQLRHLDSFRQNNLGYERPLGNININNLNYNDEKLNLNKKYMPKTNIKNVYLVNNNDESGMNEAQSEDGESVQYCSSPQLNNQNSQSDTIVHNQNSSSINSNSALFIQVEDESNDSDLNGPFLNIASNSTSHFIANDLSRSLSEMLPTEHDSVHNIELNDLS